MSYAATVGGRQQKFAAYFGDVTADANSAFNELDSYGGPTAVPPVGTPAQDYNSVPAGPSVAPSPLSVPEPAVGSVSVSGAPMALTTSGASSEVSDFNSWFPGFAQQVVQAGTTIAIDAIGSNAPAPAPMPVAPPPAPDIFGVPAPLLLLGAALFLFSR